MFKALFLFLLGAAIICLGMFAIKKPTSGFWRPIGLDKDTDPSEGYIDFIKFAGFVTVMLGSFFILGGILASL